MKNIYRIFGMMFCLACALFVENSLIYGKNFPLKPKFYQPEYAVKIQRSYVAMPDGIKLAVTFFKPVGKLRDEKFPIVLEILPYPNFMHHTINVASLERAC